MFVLDGAKARVAAVAMIAVTAVPLFPKAHAVEKPKATIAAKNPQAADAKATKKSKKKKASSNHLAKQNPRDDISHARFPWGPRPVIVAHPDRMRAERMRAAITEHALKLTNMKIVLATARKQIGKPYRWAAVGPSSFDCSGFTQYVWKQVGVMLPHNSSAQRGATRPVSRADAQPGDLVFAPGHVGLYVGDGKMIHSPQTGDHVKLSPIHSGTYGFGRPAQ